MTGFFLQAEDGIRDHCVTGVQTCALPILLTQFLARIRREISFRSANFGMICVQLFQADLRVNFEFGQKYASEKNGTIILIKLIELVILCVKSGEFMVFPTMLLASEPPLWYTSWCWEALKGRWEQS